MSSTSIENYVKAIFVLEQSAGERRVKSKSIAAELGIAQPSVTSMLKTLEAQGLIDYVPYQGARLSEVGRASALRVIRKHRLIEVFLIETLGLRWDEVHDEAEALEHAVSDKVANRLEEFLGFPTHDPHGDPIPDREGRLPAVVGSPLAVADVGLHFNIVRVLDQTPEFLRYLSEQGLVPGAAVEVLGFEPFDGPMRLRVGESDSPVHVSRSLARRIVVCETAP